MFQNLIRTKICIKVHSETQLSWRAIGQHFGHPVWSYIRSVNFEGSQHYHRAMVTIPDTRGVQYVNWHISNTESSNWTECTELLLLLLWLSLEHCCCTCISWLASAVSFMLHNHWLILQLFGCQLTSNASSYACRCTAWTLQPDTSHYYSAHTLMPAPLKFIYVY